MSIKKLDGQPNNHPLVRGQHLQLKDIEETNQQISITLFRVLLGFSFAEEDNLQREQ
jgi:hypothetical protein